MTAVVPYLSVADGDAALTWYRTTLGAEVVGEPIRMDDGSLGHAELSFEGARVFVAGSFPEIGVQAPAPGAPAPVSLTWLVTDVDGTLARARQGGAVVTREPEDTPHGRAAVFVDPFGHRWLLSSD